MENSGDSRHELGSNQRFKILMERYLNGVATDIEKEELRQFVEQGFEEPFQDKIDEVFFNTPVENELPEGIRQEILNNILHNYRPTPSYRWRGWAAAAVLLTLAVSWWLLKPVSTQEHQLISPIETVLSDEELVQVEGKQFIILPDGSSVLMNEGAKLTWSPTNFENGFREVTLIGEAYFDIAHRTDSEFKVRTGSIVTRVLGTAFNVLAQGNEVVVTVDRGLVEVRDEEDVFAQIKPDEQIIVDAFTHQFSTKSLDAEDEITWTKAFLVFNNTDLLEAAKLIGQHYDIEVHFAGSRVSNCRITASFLSGEDSHTVLNVVTEMIGATYSEEGRKVTITGGSCQ